MTTPTRPHTHRLLLLAALLSLTGCFSLGREATPQQHYVLGTVGLATPTVDSPLELPSGLVIGIRSPRLADYLATRFIVIRRGAHAVEFSDYHRWGEELGRGINRMVATQLATRAPHHRVEAAPWPAGTAPDVLVQVDILRFEGVAEGDPVTGGAEVHLLATWEILRPTDGAILARGTTEVREGGWSVGDFDGLVRLLSAALEVLAEDLALNLERIAVP